MSSCRTVCVPVALVVLVLFGSSVALAQINYQPCTMPSPAGTSRQDNYPVVVYDAYSRIATLAYKNDLLALLVDGIVSTDLIATPAPIPAFLCSQYPVEIIVINRKLKTDFNISLTAAIKAQTGHLAISGSAAAGQGTTPPSSSGTATPAAKGFTPVASGSLLTTDAIINSLLNEETFDRSLSRIQDDASAVLAQALQLRANYVSYLVNIRRIIGPVGPAATPNGNISIAAVTGEFAELTGDASGPIVYEKDFDDLLERTDRLQQEIARLNTQLQDYPVVDILVNLRASAAILRDNIRGVLTEYNSLHLAIAILHDFLELGGGPRYLIERRIAEIRTMLRNQYTSTTTVDDATLARIVNRLAEAPLDLAWVPHLIARLNALNDSLGIARPCPADTPCAERDWVDSINSALLSAAIPPPPVPGLGPHLSDLPLGYLPATGLVPPISFESALDAADGRLRVLRENLATMNGTVADALMAINNAYDTHYAPYEDLPFDLSSYGKNLNVYYTIAGSERFHRYQITNETPQPQSACALPDSANTNTAGGALTCLTPTGSPLPAAGATFSTSVPPYAALSASAAAGAAAASPSATAPTPPAAAAPPTTTAASPPPTPLPDYHGFFQLHHFSNGELITGAAYDSIPNYSYSWFTCPLNTKYPTGNMTPANCASYQTTNSTTGALTTTNYYILTQTKQVPIAAIQGINLSISGPKDTFLMYPKNFFMPDLFLGAAAFPLNHYYLGLSEAPARGLSVTGGLAYGSQTYLPSNASYQLNKVYATNASIQTSSRFRNGFFIMVGFRTALFKSIFTGSAFQNVLQIGNAGASTAQASQ
jgi:hypothetical protein